jgi:hypothetical protein
MFEEGARRRDTSVMGMMLEAVKAGETDCGEQAATLFDALLRLRRESSSRHLWASMWLRLDLLYPFSV